MKSNSHDSSKVVKFREHDKLVMTSDDELLNFSLAGKNSPPFNSNNHDITIGYSNNINILCHKVWRAVCNKLMSLIIQM